MSTLEPETPKPRGLTRRVARRVAALGITGGAYTALVGALLHGGLNALMAARAPDWDSFRFITFAGASVGGVTSLLIGGIAFAVAGVLTPHPSGRTVLRTLRRATTFGMVIGSFTGALAGLSWDVMLLFFSAYSGTRPLSRALLNMNTTDFFIKVYYGALLLMLIGLICGMIRGARSLRRPLP